MTGENWAVVSRSADRRGRVTTCRCFIIDDASSCCKSKVECAPCGTECSAAWGFVSLYSRRQSMQPCVVPSVGGGERVPQYKTVTESRTETPYVPPEIRSYGGLKHAENIELKQSTSQNRIPLLGYLTRLSQRSSCEVKVIEWTYVLFCVVGHQDGLVANAGRLCCDSKGQ